MHAITHPIGIVSRLAAVSLAGFLTGACAQLGGKGEPPPENPVVARVGDREVRMDEVESDLRPQLLKLEIDIGSEKRQIVAGIAHKYEPDALVGKTIVMVANLKPAKVRGVESQGMLLAADAGEGPVVATFETDVTPGTRVR